MGVAMAWATGVQALAWTLVFHGLSALTAECLWSAAAVAWATGVQALAWTMETGNEGATEARMD